MKLRIITVTMNSEAFLADALNSVKRQIIPAGLEIEHFIKDGLSSDCTADIVRIYASDVDYKVSFIQQSDSSIYDALNQSISNEGADYFLFLHSDDVLYDKLVFVNLYGQMLSGADFIIGDLVYVSKEDTDNIIRRWCNPNYRHNLFIFGWMPAHPATIVKRKVFQDVGLFDVNLSISADYDWLLRALYLKSYNVKNVSNFIIRMRVGGISSSGLKSEWLKLRQDISIARRHKLPIFSIVCKKMRKFAQFM